MPTSNHNNFSRPFGQLHTKQIFGSSLARLNRCFTAKQASAVIVQGLRRGGRKCSHLCCETPTPKRFSLCASQGQYLREKAAHAARALYQPQTHLVEAKATRSGLRGKKTVSASFFKQLSIDSSTTSSFPSKEWTVDRRRYLRYRLKKKSHRPTLAQHRKTTQQVGLGSTRDGTEYRTKPGQKSHPPTQLCST